MTFNKDNQIGRRIGKKGTRKYTATPLNKNICDKEQNKKYYLLSFTAEDGEFMAFIINTNNITFIDNMLISMGNWLCNYSISDQLMPCYLKDLKDESLRYLDIKNLAKICVDNCTEIPENCINHIMREAVLNHDYLEYIYSIMMDLASSLKYNNFYLIKAINKLAIKIIDTRNSISMSRAKIQYIKLS